MTANEFARGGSRWNKTFAEKGEAAALADWQWAINAERAGTLDPANAPSAGFWSALGTQLATDPLGAPFESANRTLGNTFLSFLKSPWVVVTVAVIIFAAMGGFGWLGRKIFKA